MVEKTVGAVRTRVKLTNIIDQVLIERGLLAPHLQRTCEVDALVDTGSVYLVLPETVVQQLGLRIVDRQPAQFTDARTAILGVTEGMQVECEGRRTTEDALVTGDEVLIGQVVLEKLDLLMDCKNQRLIPNPAHPDYPVTYILQAH